MAACPAPGPADPLVRSLLGTVDCNVQELVHDGYSALFAPSGGFSALLTTLLTLYVAVLGYRLMLGRAQLRVSDLALTLVKLGAILAVTTQWDTYQAVVYRFLFDGPQQLAGAMLGGDQGPGASQGGDVFDGLQRAYDALTASAAGLAKSAPPQASPLLGGAGFGAFTLTLAAGVLLLSSLGVLLVAKIVLGLLLAVGPVFIALLLFDSTRGLFEGWLRAALAFAIAPLATTLLLGVALTMLAPTLAQLAEQQGAGVVAVAPSYSVMILVLVFAGVSLGALVAGGMIAVGLKLPRAKADASAETTRGANAAAGEAAAQPRAARIAAAAAAAERRDASIMVGAQAAGERGETAAADRRATGGAPAPRGLREIAPEARLGQATRRSARPRTVRSGARSAPGSL